MYTRRRVQVRLFFYAHGCVYACQALPMYTSSCLHFTQITKAHDFPRQKNCFPRQGLAFSAAFRGTARWRTYSTV